MWSFLKNNVLTSILFVCGGALALASRVNDAYSLINAGLPNGAWEAIGLAIFFFTVIAILYRFSSQYSETKKPPISKARPFLKDVNIFSASISPPLNARFTAKFARNGSRGRFYVDHSHFMGFGSDVWIGPNRIFLAEVKDFVAEQAVDIAILTAYERDGKKHWRWGQGDKDSPPTGHSLFAATTWHHRCRVTFIPNGDNAEPEYFYFIVDTQCSDETPRLIPLYYFHFAEEWEPSQKA